MADTPDRSLTWDEIRAMYPGLGTNKFSTEMNENDIRAAYPGLGGGLFGYETPQPPAAAPLDAVLGGAAAAAPAAGTPAVLDPAAAAPYATGAQPFGPPEYDPQGRARVATDVLRQQYPGVQYGFMDTEQPGLGQIYLGQPPQTPGTAAAGPSVPSGAGFAPPRSTADLADWRNRYKARDYGLDWGEMRNRSQDAISNINAMPWMYNPTSLGRPPSRDTATQRGMIFPGAGKGENAISGLWRSILGTPGTPGTPTTPSATDVQGLLAMLTPEQTAALKNLIGTIPPEQLTAATAAMPSGSSAATGPQPDEFGHTPTFNAAGVRSDEAYYGLQPNTFQDWRLYGFGPRGINPQTDYFYAGLTPEGQNQWLYGTPADRGKQNIDTLLKGWKPPEGRTNPYG